MRYAQLLLLALASTAGAQVSLTSSMSDVYDVKPGQEVTGTISLRNAGNNAQTVRLRITDYTFSPEGSQMPAAGTLPRSNAKWITLPADSVTVPARGKLDLPYKMTVPANTAPGTNWSLISITPDVALKQGAITQVTQFTVQVITTVPGAQAKVAFANPVFGKSPAGDSVFRVDSRNDGEQWIFPAMRLELYGPDGQLVTKVQNKQRRMYPGTGLRNEFTLGRLHPGAYTALIFADDGSSNVSGVKYKLNVKE